MDREQLSKKIGEMKECLERMAIRHQFNLGHPQVIQMSQKLDILIVQAMKRMK
jgi:hypothetical protein